MSGRGNWVEIARAVNGDASQEELAEANAEIELLQAELQEERVARLFDQNEYERRIEKLERAIRKHRAPINAPHRRGNTYDIALWEAIR